MSARLGWSAAWPGGRTGQPGWLAQLGQKPDANRTRVRPKTFPDAFSQEFSRQGSTRLLQQRERDRPSLMGGLIWGGLGV